MYKIIEGEWGLLDKKDTPYNHDIMKDPEYFGFDFESYLKVTKTEHSTKYYQTELNKVKSEFDKMLNEMAN